MEILPQYKESIRYELAKKSLEVNFLKWLTNPNTTQLIQKLIAETKKPASQVSTPPSPVFQPRTSTPQVSSPKRSSLTPPLSPTAYEKFSGSQSQSLPPEAIVAPAKPQPTPASPPLTKPVIPQFYFPQGNPVDPQLAEKNSKLISQLFSKESLRVNEFERVCAEVCELPRIIAPLLFAEVGGKETLNKQQFLKYWREHLENKTPVNRLFNLLRKRKNWLEREDFKPLLRILLENHPGLDFLKATPEFQDRYADTVIERIFYMIDSSDTGKITLRELKRSNLLDTMFSLDEEEDINKIRDYFSYEHFYVLYCRFWELDTDHDFFIDKEDFSRYEGHTLSRKAIDRIFEQVPRKFTSEVPGKVNYEDFICKA